MREERERHLFDGALYWHYGLGNERSFGGGALVGARALIRGNTLFHYLSFYFLTLVWYVLRHWNFKTASFYDDQIMHRQCNAYTASLKIKTRWIDTATLKLLPCWQPHDAQTPQLLNCFPVDNHMMHRHRNLKTVPLLTTIWSQTPQLLNGFLVDKHTMHRNRNFWTATLLTNTWCVDTATFKLLLCWQTRDALTPQFLNCFLVEKHIIHRHQNFQTVSLKCFSYKSSKVEGGFLSQTLQRKRSKCLMSQLQSYN